jgi:hypothetical protein
MRPSITITREVLLASFVVATVLLWRFPAFAGTPSLGPDCGAGAALVGTSSDSAGKVALGTDPAATCTVAFGVTYTNAPACSATDETAGRSLVAVTTQAQAAISSPYVWNPGDVISYMCAEY